MFCIISYVTETLMWQIFTQDLTLKGLNTCLPMEQSSTYSISQAIDLLRRLREYVEFLQLISMVWQADLLGRTCTYKEELNVPRDLHTGDSCTLLQPIVLLLLPRGVHPSDVHLLSHLWCHLLSHWLCHLLI